MFTSVYLIRFKLRKLIHIAVLSLSILFFDVYSSSLCQEHTDTLTQVVITADRERINSTQTGLTELDSTKFKSGYAFLSSPDVVKVIQMLPGVASGTELMSGMYVHGGDGSDNLFLLDGVPLYQVSHLAGLFSPFNADVVEKVDFYKSGFPARYGGRLSSVVDIKTKEGDYHKFKGQFSVGLIDGRVQVEGPIVKGKSSYNVALRRSWLDLVTAPAFAIYNIGRSNRTSFRYSMTDFNANVSFILGPGDKLIARLYTGWDMLMTKEEKDQKIYGSEIFEGMDRRALDIDYGNLTGSVQWLKNNSSTLKSKMTLYALLGNSTIGSDTYTWKVDEDTGYDLSSENREINDCKINLIGLNADFDWKPTERQHVRFGGSYQYHVFAAGRSRRISEPFKKDSVRYDNSYFNHELSAFVEDEISVTHWLKANVGLRYGFFSTKAAPYHVFEPRAALKWQISEQSSFKLSYTEMSQFVHLISAMYFDLPTNMWMPSTENIKPMQSKQFAAGYYHKLPYGMHVNVEGWYKEMDHLLEYQGMSSIFPPVDKWETSFIDGQGLSYGGELEYGYTGTKVEATLYYTLSWNNRLYRDIYPSWYPDRNDNRHKITLMGTWKISPSVDFYAAWNYHSGGWMTIPEKILLKDNQASVSTKEINLIEFYSRPNNSQLPDYHRLDMGCNIRKKTKKGHECIWNISVYNAYCRLNPFSIVLERADDGKFVGQAYAFIPIIPSFSYTYKF